jgi:uncharacterized protein YneR
MNTWLRIALVSTVALILLEPTALVMGNEQANTSAVVSGGVGTYQHVDHSNDDIRQSSQIPVTLGCITVNSNSRAVMPVIVSGPSVSRVPIFPSDHIWNTRVDSLPVDSRSAEYIGTIGSTAYLHADFGSGMYEGNPIGIPYNIVNSSLEKKTVQFDYADESDAGPYPIPDNPSIEGGSDHHLVIIDRDAKILYELYAAEKQADGSWAAGSGAVFNLSGYTLRPTGWTSADAAGLAIFPGLVRYNEVETGEINHALRFTAPSTRRAYIWPARHYASSITDQTYPPMGQRFRLKSSFNTSGYSYQALIVLEALKKYGMILSDNGAPWYITGAPDEQWNNDALHTLHQLKGSDFEAVDCSSLIINQDSGQAMINPVVSNTSYQIGIFRNGTWYLDYDTNGVSDTTFKFGTTGDSPVIGDWDGDRKDGIAIYRPSTGYWYFDNNLDRIVDKSFRYGSSTDLIINGDWQGTGKDGIAIFRPSTGYWYFDNNLDGIVDKSFRYGSSADRIIKGDWDDDRKDGIAIFRPSTGYWYFDNNLDGIVDKSFRYGSGNDQIIAGDWKGTGKDGIAIFRSSTGYWYFDYNLDGNVETSFRYGGNTDKITRGDWDGDRKDGIAIFRPSTGYWYFDNNLDGIVDKSFRYGVSTDRIIIGNWA